MFRAGVKISGEPPKLAAFLLASLQPRIVCTLEKYEPMRIIKASTDVKVFRASGDWKPSSTASDPRKPSPKKQNALETHLTPRSLESLKTSKPQNLKTGKGQKSGGRELGESGLPRGKTSCIFRNQNSSPALAQPGQQPSPQVCFGFAEVTHFRLV